jgi:uncharacterized protein
VPCTHCQFCEFSPICDQQWRDERSTFRVARIRTAEKSALTASNICTIDALADTAPPVEGVKDERLGWLGQQASLHCTAETQTEMPYAALDSLGDAGEPEDDDYKHRLPQPDEGDVFIDFEGHPYWTVEQGMFFLFGCLEHHPSDGSRSI